MSKSVKTEIVDGQSGLVEAVVSVWTAVLARHVAPDADFIKISGDQRKATRIVLLLNQWLGSKLAVKDLFSARTPQRLADILRQQVGQVIQGEKVDVLPYERLAGRVGEWKDQWEATYRFSAPPGNDTFETPGWFDNHSLVPLSEEDMREWIATTASRVRRLSPESVLDVGCGNGLLMMELAPGCARYCGIDFSAEATRKARSKVAGQAHANITIHQGQARDIDHLVVDRYDVVIINSVVQYFPDMDYLRDVLQSALSRMTSQGAIFIGDLRNRDLHRAAYTSLVAAHAPDNMAAKVVLRAVDATVVSDSELLLSPSDLRSIAAEVCETLSVRTLVRRGSRPTVMNRFRFDALLSRGNTEALIADRIIEWDPRKDSDQVIMTLKGELKSGTPSIVLRSLPDSRSFHAVQLSRALDATSSSSHSVDSPSLGQIRSGISERAAIDPEDFWNLAEMNGYGAAISPCDLPGHIDAAFVRGEDEWSASRYLI